MFTKPPQSAELDVIVLQDTNLTDVDESADKLLFIIETAPPLFVAELYQKLLDVAVIVT